MLDCIVKVDDHRGLQVDKFDLLQYHCRRIVQSDDLPRCLPAKRADFVLPMMMIVA